MIKTIQITMFIIIVILSFSMLVSSAQGGTIHAVSGYITYSDGGSPAGGVFQAWITARPGEVITQDSAGSHVVSGWYLVQCAEFSVWIAGDTCHVEFTDNDGRTAVGEVVLTFNAFDLMDLVINRPEMTIKGAGVDIADGDTTPSTTDDTDFGNVLVSGGTVDHTFTIRNTGAGDLTITTPLTVGGTHAADFTVTAQPIPPVHPGGSTDFTIRFDPSGTGLRSATINIANNDADENPYDFAIQGTGLEPDITVTSPNGGEWWQIDRSHDITWASIGTSGNVKVEYSINNGTDWTTVTAGTPDDGNHPWMIPDTPSENCLVKITDTDGSPSDQSDAVFTISVDGILGDVNSDGIANSTDALIVLSCDVGMNTSQFCQMNCGDVNGDGFINSTDALIILSYDVGMPVPFPVEEPGCPQGVTPCPGCE